MSHMGCALGKLLPSLDSIPKLLELFPARNYNTL